MGRVIWRDSGLPPADKVATPPAETRVVGCTSPWSPSGVGGHWPSATLHHSMSARTRRSETSEPEERRGCWPAVRARLLAALERESGYGEERTEGEDAERRREGMTTTTKRCPRKRKRTPRGLTRRRDELVVVGGRGPKVEERWETTGEEAFIIYCACDDVNVERVPTDYHSLDVVPVITTMAEAQTHRIHFE